MHPFPTPLKTSESRFQRVEKGWIGKEWVGLERVNFKTWKQTRNLTTSDFDSTTRDFGSYNLSFEW